jgi:voltage-gated potassium channel
LKRTIIRATNTIREVMAVYAVVLIVAAIGFALFEQKSFWDSIWWAAVTATSTGYGDFFPVTVGGRVIGGVLMHLSILVILPLLIGHVINTLIENQDRFSHDEQVVIMETLAELKAAAAIEPWVITDGEQYVGFDELGPVLLTDHREAARFYDRASARSVMAAHDYNEGPWAPVQVTP